MEAPTPDFKYDAFISYRRFDGTAIATRLRRRLVDYKMPEGFAAGSEKLSIYQDIIYEKATEDFFKNNIQPALAQSRVLIVVYTPSIMLATPGGELNWVCREIAYFRTLPQGSNIWIAIGKGTFNDPLPMDLANTHPNIHKLDVRSLDNYFPSINSDELAKIVAPLRNVPVEKLPEFRRENWQIAQRRRRHWMISILAIVTVITIISIVAITGWGRARAETLRQRAQRISFQAGSIPSGEFDLALLMVAGAQEVSPVTEASRSVLDILNQNAHLLKYFHCSPGQRCRGAQFVGKTGWLAVKSDDRVSIWDIQSGKLVAERNEKQTGCIKFIHQWDLLLAVNDSSLLSFEHSKKNWKAHQWEYAAPQEIWESDSLVIVEWPNNQLLQLNKDKATGNIYASPADSMARVYVDEQKLVREEIKNNATLDFCKQRPVFRYEPPILFDLKSNFIAFANEENQVIVKNQYACYTLYGNTHNLGGLAMQRSGDTILVASYGQIGRNRFGVIVWNLGQFNPVMYKILPQAPHMNLVSVSDDGRLLAVAGTEGIKIIDRNAAIIRTVPLKQDAYQSKARFCADNKAFSVVLQSGELFNFSIGTEIKLKDTLQNVFDVAFDNEGGLVIINKDGNVLLKKGGKITRAIQLNGIPGDQYHVNTNTGWIVVQRDTVLEGYNYSRGPRVRIADPTLTSYTCTGIWSGGDDLFFKSINTYDGAPIQIFSLKDQRKIKEIENPFVNKSGLATTVAKIVVSEDGRHLVAQLQGDKPRIVIWQKEGTEYQILGQVIIPGLSDYQYSHVSKEIFVQNNSGLYAFTIDPGEWSKTAQRIANRELTAGEIVNHNMQD